MDRDTLRAATLGKCEAAPRTTITIAEGVEVEFQRPSVKVRTRILKNSGFMAEDSKDRDVTKFYAWSAIECCYVPGTNDKVFEPADIESLSNQLCGSWLDNIGTIANKELNIVPDEARKNLKAITKD